MAEIYVHNSPFRPTVNRKFGPNDFRIRAKQWWRDQGVESPIISTGAMIVACVISGRLWRLDRRGRALLAIGTLRQDGAAYRYRRPYGARVWR